MLRRSYPSLSLFHCTPACLLTVIKMPALSPTMEKGTLVGWDMKIGDKIEENSCLAKVQTDKATNDFNFVGDECFLARIIAEAGAVVQVGEPVALAVDEASEVNSDAVKNWKAPAAKKAAVAAPAAAAAPKKTAAPVAAKKPAPTAAKKASAATTSKKEALPIEMMEAVERSGPAVLRLASSLSVSQIRSLLKDTSKASGLRKRFTKADVLKMFPKVDFSVPSAESPFVHASTKGDAPAPSSSGEGKGQEKKKEEKRYVITQQIQPGVPGKFNVHDDAILSFLMKKK